MSETENLLVEILPAEWYGLFRPYLVASLVFLLLLCTAISKKSTTSLSSYNLLSFCWTHCQTTIGNVFDSIETMTTGSLSPPLPDQLPGPRGVPFLGYLPFIGKLPHLSLARVAERYGGRMFRLVAGCRRYVVVSQLETVRELARRYPQELRGKPRTFTTEQMTLGAHNDLVQRWKRRRAYTEAGLKVLEQTTISGTVGVEVSQLISDLDRAALSGTPTDIRHQVAMYAGRTMYRVAYGCAPDSRAIDGLSRLVDALPDYTTTIGSLSLFDVLPFWRRVRASCFRRFIEFNQAASEFCRQAKLARLSEPSLATASVTHSQPSPSSPSSLRGCKEECRSLLDFFRLRWNRTPATDIAKFALTDEILFDGLEDIIRAGTESTSLLIKWCLLYVASYPDVQRRMQAEIDEYLEHNRSGDQTQEDEQETTDENGNECKKTGSGGGNRRRLNADDLSKLVYCRATLMETFRFSALNPFLKRELTDDILLPVESDDENRKEEAVCLPRGTVLLYNTWAINNDRRHWVEPEHFRPDRFLRPKAGTTAEMEFDEEKMDLFVPFGFGRRRCIGIETGKIVCMLAATSIVQRFHINLHHDNSNRCSDLEPIFGIGLAPKSYRLVLSRRRV